MPTIIYHPFLLLLLLLLLVLLLLLLPVLLLMMLLLLLPHMPHTLPPEPAAPFPLARHIQCVISDGIVRDALQEGL